ncbi:phospholipase D-like domain-containing protein [Singulisphaera sp. PoT]|uniref:phospholipase D-like domain-containing protein n=1 Tax=Singulisphaera sp. PoT TaxID=3411797 RepID=UPI003BF50C81
MDINVPMPSSPPKEVFWFLSPLLTSLGFLLALVLLARMLRTQRSPSSTIAWLLIILLLPYVGVPLYLMFGGRKMRIRAGRKEPVYHFRRISRETSGIGPAERVLQSYGVPPATPGNRIQALTSGEEAYRHLINLIDNAKTSIHITTYVLGMDDVAQAIITRLAGRAREGVEVRLLLDSVGSWRLRRYFLAPLYESKAEVAFFMPVLHTPFRGRANLRNHRKIVVVDGREALTGGMNLAEEYMGPTPNPKRWRDFSLAISGPAVADLAELFRSDWKFTTGKSVTIDATPAPPIEGETTVAQVVASGPDVAGDPLFESLVSLMFTATSRIWVVTPYFVPDETLAKALDLAARRGVDVRLIMPEHSNHLMADLARASYIRELHSSGGHVMLFEPVMLHAKVVLIDNHVAIVGSANMDMRSLFLNYEVALFLTSRGDIEETTAWVESIMAESHTELPVGGRFRALAEDVVRLLSPLL